MYCVAARVVKWRALLVATRKSHQHSNTHDITSFSSRFRAFCRPILRVAFPANHVRQSASALRRVCNERLVVVLATIRFDRMDLDAYPTQTEYALATAALCCLARIDVAPRSCCRVSCVRRRVTAAYCFSSSMTPRHLMNARSRHVAIRFRRVVDNARRATRPLQVYLHHQSNAVETTRCCTRTATRSVAHCSLRVWNFQSCHAPSAFLTRPFSSRFRAFCRLLVREADRAA